MWNAEPVSWRRHFTSFVALPYNQRQGEDESPLALLNQKGISKGFKALVATSVWVCFQIEQAARSLVFAAVVVIIVCVPVHWEFGSPEGRTETEQGHNSKLFSGINVLSGGNQNFSAVKVGVFFLFSLLFSFFLNFFSIFFFVWQLMGSRTKVWLNKC